MHSIKNGDALFSAEINDGEEKTSARLNINLVALGERLFEIGADPETAHHNRCVLYNICDLYKNTVPGM